VIILDENIFGDQRRILEGSGIAVRQIGKELGHDRTDDEGIIPILHHLPKPTFFTYDQDFFDPNLRHDRYCLVWLDVRVQEVASFVRRFLRHRDFNTKKKRMGTVVQVSPQKIKCWRKNAKKAEYLLW
jgi:hypothetical protein